MGSASHRRLLAGSVLMLGIFTAIELRSKHPLLPMRVVLDRNRVVRTRSLVWVAPCWVPSVPHLLLPGNPPLLRRSRRVSPSCPSPAASSWCRPGQSPSATDRSPGPHDDRTGPGRRRARLVHASRVDTSYLGSSCPPRSWSAWGMGMTFVPMSSTALVGVEPKTRRRGQRVGQHHTASRWLTRTALLNTLAATAATTYLATHAKAPWWPGRRPSTVYDRLYRERRPAGSGRVVAGVWCERRVIRCRPSDRDRVPRGGTGRGRSSQPEPAAPNPSAAALRLRNSSMAEVAPARSPVASRSNSRPRTTAR